MVEVGLLCLLLASPCRSRKAVFCVIEVVSATPIHTAATAGRSLPDAVRGLTFREAEVRLGEHRELRQALGLVSVPDFTTLCIASCSVWTK